MVDGSVDHGGRLRPGRGRSVGARVPSNGGAWSRRREQELLRARERARKIVGGVKIVEVELAPTGAHESAEVGAHRGWDGTWHSTITEGAISVLQTETRKSTCRAVAAM